MPKSLPLDTTSWDLVLDGAGNLNLTDEDNSIAQDVASAVRTFLGECWYNNLLGMPYFQSILGKLPPASLVISKITQQALTIVNVQTVKVIGLRLNDRRLTGTIVINKTLVVNF